MNFETNLPKTSLSYLVALKAGLPQAQNFSTANCQIVKKNVTVQNITSYKQLLKAVSKKTLCFR